MTPISQSGSGGQAARRRTVGFDGKLREPYFWKRNFQVALQNEPRRFVFAEDDSAGVGS